MLRTQDYTLFTCGSTAVDAAVGILGTSGSRPAGVPATEGPCLQSRGAWLTPGGALTCLPPHALHFSSAFSVRPSLPVQAPAPPPHTHNTLLLTCGMLQMLSPRLRGKELTLVHDHGNWGSTSVVHNIPLPTSPPWSSFRRS